MDGYINIKPRPANLLRYFYGFKRDANLSPHFQNVVKGINLTTLISTTINNLVTYHWKGQLTEKVMTLKIGVCDTPGQNGVDKLSNFDIRLPFWTGLTYAPVSSSNVYILPYYFKELIIKKRLTIINYGTHLF